MRNAVIASTAFMATSALAQGTAHVVNNCPYKVYLQNTPAQFNGYDNVATTLESRGSGDASKYSQQYVELDQGGWSIKLAKENAFQTNLLQYEYTYQGPPWIWYDLSQVDGNPWDGDWMITASEGCNPKQQAYRYATDDAYGMQSCPYDAAITVTLCSGSQPISGDGGSSSPEPTQPEPETTPAPTATSKPQTTMVTKVATTTEQAAETTAAAQNNNWGNHWHGFKTNADGVWIGKRDEAPTKRHSHHAAHPHQRREE